MIDYSDIREALALILRAELPGQAEAQEKILYSLDDAVVNNI